MSLEEIMFVKDIPIVQSTGGTTNFTEKPQQPIAHRQGD